jgi:DNA-binding response OmpR family regulator
LWREQPTDAESAPDALAGSEAMADRILICEDDPDIAHLLKLMLQTHGYAAEVARNAAEAKAMLANNHYIAMTLDLMLPDQNGLDLFRELREDENTSQLPVIVVSAIADRGKQELNGDAIHVVDWLDKPINEDLLVAAIGRSVGQSQSDQARILHVEDEPDVRSIVSALLTDTSQITAAGSLKEARQCLAGENFDLVILDLGLPDGSGLSLLHELAQRSPQIPVVLFSAQEIETHLSHGVAAALVKSKTSNEMLMNTIHATIAKQSKVAEEA